MLVRRPTGPIARLGDSKTGKQAPRLHILPHQDVEMTLLPRRSRAEFQRGIFFDFRVRHELQRIAVLYLGGKLGNIHFSPGSYFDFAVTRNVKRVILLQVKFVFTYFDCGIAREADKAGLVIAIFE